MRLKRILTWTVLTLLLACGTIWATSNSWNYPVPTLGGLTTGDVIYARSGYALGNISPSTSGYPLLSQGASTAPVFGQVALTTGITGTLPVANGGTNITSYTIGDMLYASAAGVVSKLTAVAVGQTLVSAGTGTAPVWSDIPRLGKQLRTYQATVPTCSTNCGTSPSVVGTDSAGLITLGSTPSNDYVLVFNATWGAAPICVAQQQTTGANYVTKSVSTTTTLTITGAAGPTAADKVKYICIGQS